MLDYQYVNHIFNKYFEILFVLNYDLGYWLMLFNRYKMHDTVQKCESFVKFVRESVNGRRLSKVQQQFEKEDQDTQTAMLSFANNVVFYVALRNKSYDVFLYLLKSANQDIVRNVLTKGNNPLLQKIIKGTMEQDDPFMFEDKFDLIKLLPADAREHFLTFDFSNLFRYACEMDCANPDNRYENVFSLLEFEQSALNRDYMIYVSNISPYIKTKGFNGVVLSAARKGAIDVVAKLLSYANNPDITYSAIIAAVKVPTVGQATKDMMELYCCPVTQFRQDIDRAREARKMSEQVKPLLLSQPSSSEPSFAGGVYGVLPKPAALSSSRPTGVLHSKQDPVLLTSSSSSSASELDASSSLPSFAGGVYGVLPGSAALPSSKPAGVLHSKQDPVLLTSSSSASTSELDARSAKRPRFEGGKEVVDGGAKKSRILGTSFYIASGEKDSIVSYWL